jgi:hypothetical protein
VLFESKGPREDGESEKKEGLHMSWPTAYGLLIGVGCTLALLLVMVLTRNTGSGAVLVFEQIWLSAPVFGIKIHDFV